MGKLNFLCVKNSTDLKIIFWVELNETKVYFLPHTELPWDGATCNQVSSSS